LEFICDKNILSDGINTAQKAVMPKAALQILEGILIKAENSLTITGNSLEIGIVSNVEAEIVKTGSIVVNSRIFGEIIRKLPEGNVKIQVDELNNVIIECKNSHFKIKGIDSSGYPEIPEVEQDNKIVLTQNVLREMIKHTLFSVSIDDNRPVLTGVLIESESNRITFVAIDGFRMALRNFFSDQNYPEFSVIVPAKTLSEISKIIQPTDENIEIYVSKSQILFSTNNCKLVSKLIEGEFINYKNLLPEKFESNISIDRTELLSSIERVSLITSDGRRNPVKFDIKRNNLTLTTNTEIGNVREDIEIEVDGEKLSLGFNPKYFIDCLRVIEEEKITISFSSEIGPSIIKSGIDEYIYLILPIKIR